MIITSIRDLVRVERRQAQAAIAIRSFARVWSGNEPVPCRAPYAPEYCPAWARDVALAAERRKAEGAPGYDR